MSTNRSGMQLWMRKCRAQYSYDATIRDATASCLHNSPNRKTDTSNSAKKERICKMTLSNAIQIVKQYFDANAMTLDETEAFITLIQTVEGEHANECNLLPQWYMQVFPLPWRYWPREVQLHVLLLSALRTLRRLRRKIHLHAKRDQRLFGMWYTAPQRKLRFDCRENASYHRIDAKDIIPKKNSTVRNTQKKRSRQLAAFSGGDNYLSYRRIGSEHRVWVYWRREPECAVSEYGTARIWPVVFQCIFMKQPLYCTDRK